MDVHDLPFADCGDARRRELGRFLDIHQAHATDAGDRKAGVVAVVRNQHAHCLGGFQNCRSGRHADRAPLDRQVHDVGVGHQDTTTGTTWAVFLVISDSKSGRKR